MAKSETLLFVDTNIFLDFYRSRSEVGLALLNHLEQASNWLLSTYQLEMEYKKSRQRAILEGIAELKAPASLPRHGLFSDARAVKTIKVNQERIATRIKLLRERFEKALVSPTTHDPVYQACQRLFHRHDPLVLGRDDKNRHEIRRKAFRRFLLGCPPRKPGDTSIGDAFNWEWMIHCASTYTTNLVIVSRDSDYGILHNGKALLNDHLKQEFSERVKPRRKIVLYSRLSDALREFQVQVSASEVEEEEEIATRTPSAPIAAQRVAQATPSAGQPVHISRILAEALGLVVDEQDNVKPQGDKPKAPD